MTRDPRGSLATAYRSFTRLLEGLTPEELFAPTRCAGWAVVDVIVHVLADAQRALVALAMPVDAEPDTDAVTYWRDWPAGSPTAAASARFTRIVASAYRGLDGLLAHWRDTSKAALRAAASTSLDQVVMTQGHALRVDDLLDTLTVEAAIHYLDALVKLPGAPPPDPAPLAVVRRTLDGLLGRLPPEDWDDEMYALKATGRLPLTDEDRRTLGTAAGSFPLFG